MSIVKRGNTYSAIVYCKDENGKRKQKWLSGYATKAEAEKAEKEFLAKRTLGKLPPSGNDTFEDFAYRWLNRHKRGIEGSTTVSYESYLRNKIIPQLGKMKLNDIKPMYVDEFIIGLQDEGCSSCYIHGIFCCLRMIMTDAFRNKLIDANPCEDTWTPQAIPQKPPKILKVDEVQQLIQYIADKRYGFEVMMFLCTGVRLGELIGIKECDIDWDNKQIHIQRQVTQVKRLDNNGTTYTVTAVKDKLKTHKSNRYIDVSDDTLALIKTRIQRNREWKEKYGDMYTDKGFLCCREDGDFVRPTTLRNNYKKYLVRCGLEKMRVHDLRHTFTSLCIDNGVPAQAVSETLGHSDMRTTLSIYTHSLKNKEVPDKLNSVLFPKSSE